MTEPLLLVENLHVSVGEGDDTKEILRGVDLKVFPGEIHAIMGPNGSGKSTLASVLMGKPGYEVTEGRILFKGEDLADLSPDERARKRIFLAFQYPTEIPGVSVDSDNILGPLEFRKYLQTKMDLLEVPNSIINRYVNAGFSGGERKRAEVLQMAVLDPDLAVLDETDTGLDIDALKEVSAGVLKVHNETRGMLVITHYQRLLNYIQPGFIHVLISGKIVRSGGKDLALDLEAKGYDQFRVELGLPEGDAAEAPK
jgi:Fe-S cluster assembly ATP-binding protein